MDWSVVDYMSNRLECGGLWSNRLECGGLYE